MTDAEFLSSFRHEPDGTWTCIKPVLLHGPERNVAVVPGTTLSAHEMLAGCHLGRELDAAENRQKH